MWPLQERIGLFRLFFWILNIWIYNFWDVTFAFYLCELSRRQVTSSKLTFFRNLDLSINCDGGLLADGICLCKAIHFILVYSSISRNYKLPDTTRNQPWFYSHLLLSPFIAWCAPYEDIPMFAVPGVPSVPSGWSWRPRAIGQNLWTMQDQRFGHDFFLLEESFFIHKFN